MKFTGKIIQVKSDSVRFVCKRRRLDGARVERQPPQQIQFGRVSEPLQGGFFEEGRPGALLRWKVGNDFPGIAEYRMPPGVPVLHIEYRVVLGLLDHLGEVEIQNRIVLAE